MLGSWNVDIQVGALPQKIASAFGNLELVGAEYSPIAYLGSQVVNGVNHAVLAEQLLTVGKDVKNIVLMIFNEKGNDITLSNIERVVEQGGQMGGIQVDVHYEIPDEAKIAFAKVFDGYVGANIDLKVYLGSQVVKGVNYIMLAEVDPVVQNPQKEVALITVNALTDEASFVDILGSKTDKATLNYAFTWLKKNVALGKPLGEWP